MFTLCVLFSQDSIVAHLRRAQIDKLDDTRLITRSRAFYNVHIKGALRPTI